MSQATLTYSSSAPPTLLQSRLAVSAEDRSSIFASDEYLNWAAEAELRGAIVDYSASALVAARLAASNSSLPAPTLGLNDIRTLLSTVLYSPLSDVSQPARVLRDGVAFKPATAAPTGQVTDAALASATATTATTAAPSVQITDAGEIADRLAAAAATAWQLKPVLTQLRIDESKQGWMRNYLDMAAALATGSTGTAAGWAELAERARASGVRPVTNDAQAALFATVATLDI